MYFIIYLTIIIWWYRKCYCFPSINFAELGTVPHVGKRKISHFETGVQNTRATFDLLLSGVFSPVWKGNR